MNLKKYKTIIFDCDGVILNSNKIKSDAFYHSTLEYGSENAALLVDFHKANGGISRNIKFNYFINEIIKLPEVTVEKLMDNYAMYVWNGLLNCEICEGLSKLRKIIPDTKWIIISGGNQEELKKVFKIRSIDHFFDGGIYGSPSPKEVLFEQEIVEKYSIKDCVYLGDSKYDFECARKFSIDFIFMHCWTEVENWENYCLKNNIPSAHSVKELINIIG